MATRTIKCNHCGNQIDIEQVDGALYDVAAIEAESRAMEAIAKKPTWTVKDVAVYIRRSPWYVRQLFNKGTIRRDSQNLTRKEWVHEYLDRPVSKGRLKSPIH